MGERKMKLLIIVLGLAFGSIALADAAEQVRCREIAFSVSVETQDVALFESFIDADARFVGNSVLHGPDAIAEAWGGFFADDGPLIKWRPRFVEVLEDGKLALTRGPYRMITRDEQELETEHWGTFNSVWRLHADGEWRVVFDAGNDPNETPTDEVKALLDKEDDCYSQGGLQD
jgi:ketosteroid isomerase-like protein